VDGACSAYKEIRNAYKILVIGKRPLGIFKCRWEDDIKMEVKVTV
jgi:hypothetical protein